jgi:hypothetical protein
VYTLLGYGVDADNQMVGIVKFSGNITQTRNCQFEFITAMVDVYYPHMDPFKDDPFATFPFPGQWGRRTHVELQ